MQIKSSDNSSKVVVSHEITLEKRDVLRITAPSGAIITIASDADAVIFQRFEHDHESMVAINAPLFRADGSRATVVMCGPRVISDQLESGGIDDVKS